MHGFMNGEAVELWKADKLHSGGLTCDKSSFDIMYSAFQPSTFHEKATQTHQSPPISALYTIATATTKLTSFP